MSDFSPTGYWAHYLLTEDFMSEVNAGRPGEGKKMPSSVHLPVVTWTPDGTAAVFDLKGNLTAVGGLYPDSVAKYWCVDASPDWRDQG